MNPLVTSMPIPIPIPVLDIYASQLEFWDRKRLACDAIPIPIPIPGPSPHLYIS